MLPLSHYDGEISTHFDRQRCESPSSMLSNNIQENHHSFYHVAVLSALDTFHC